MKTTDSKSNASLSPSSSSEPIGWATLEEYIRLQVQDQVQALLEAEVEEHLGRGRYERRGGQPAGYRNGMGRPRKLSLATGTIEVQRPRLRELEEKFTSSVLPLFKRQSEKVRHLLPTLYLEGLALRDFDRALRALLGDGAALSPSTISRLTEQWQAEFDAWRKRPIEDEIVYVWADGIYVKAGLEKDKSAVLVVIGLTRTGEKQVLAIEEGYRESTESWKSLLWSLMKRGMNVPRLVVADGGLGLWAALRELGWECKEQRCWNHKLCNVRDALPLREQKRAMKELRRIPQAKTRAEAERLRDDFLEAFKDYPKACQRLSDDWERMVSFYAFPREHWRSLRTTNPVESPFQLVRLRTGAARRFKRTDHAVAILWKLLMIAEGTFKTYDSVHLLTDVAAGTEFADGLPLKAPQSHVA